MHIQVQIAKIGKRVVPDNHYINLGVELKSKYRKDHEMSVEKIHPSTFTVCPISYHAISQIKMFR